MNKWWNTKKEKRREKEVKNLGEKGLHYIQEIKKWEEQIANLQGNNTEEIIKTTKKKDDEDEKISQKQSKGDIASKHDSESETKESDENGTNSIILKHKRPRKRSTRRCHLCRKRGHIKRECPFGPVL